jgi:hypothetical protein
MDLAAALSLAHELLSTPLPETGYRLVDLEVSDDFYYYDDFSAARAAWARLDAERARLVDALTERWGAPEQVELLARGVKPRSPLARDLAGFVTEVHAWRREGRDMCVGLGQGDKELPIQLVLGAGDLATNQWPESGRETSTATEAPPEAHPSAE